MKKYVIKLTRGIKISELEKYEFEKRYDIKTGKVTHYVNTTWRMSIDVKKRIIEPQARPQQSSFLMPYRNTSVRSLNEQKYFTNEDVCNLFDLIMAGLVEKVSE